jgi:antitoxin ParD1/3/4
MPTRNVRDGRELVIRDALQHWKECRAEELRRLWQAGIESGPGRFKSINAIKEEARREVANAEA